MHRFQDVCELLKDRVDFTRDTLSLRILLKAAINSDRRNLTSSIFDELPEGVLANPIYLRLQVLHSMNAGDLQHAIPLIEKYLELRPNDLELTYHLVASHVREGNEQKAKDSIDIDLSRLEGPAILKMQLCLLLSRFARHQTAIELGYKTLIENIGDPVIHKSFAGLVFSVSKKAPELFEKDEVGIDTAFSIQDGDDKHTLIIEPEAALRRVNEMVSPEHEIATAAHGLKTGETFSLPNRMGVDTTWTITEVVHKYLKQHFSILEHFNVHFPGESGFERVKIEENDLQPILDTLDRRKDSINTGFEQYTNSNVPLRFVGRLLGGDPISTYYGLLQCDLKFKVCIGATEERSVAIANVQNAVGSGCIIDAITLNLVIRLNLYDAIEKLFGKINITQATRDIFFNKLEEIRVFEGETYRSMHARDGQYFWDERTPEQVDELISAARSDLDFITSNCDVIPATGTRDPSADYRDVMCDVDGTIFDDLLAAQSSGQILISEDYGYRTLASSDFSVNTAWLQPTLMLCRDNELISAKEYEEAITSLCGAKHDYMSVDGRTLLHAANKDCGDQHQHLESVVQYLFTPNADLDSHFRVCAQFLAVIWASRSTDPRTSFQTGMIVKKIAEHLGNSSLEGIAALLKLIPPSVVGCHDYVAQWCLANSLVTMEEVLEARKNLGAKATRH